MELNILHKQILNGIPSASGIEKIGDYFYVVGDNSPYIFKLDEQYEIIDKFEIFSINNLRNGVIPKKDKPDFEAIASIKENNDDILLIFGSGSKSPQRNLMIKFNCNTKEVKSYNLSDFYTEMRLVANLKESDLNIEAAALKDNTLLLFNRGINLIMLYNVNDFKRYLKQNETIPTPIVYHVNLPKINNIESGFSGASFIKNTNKIVFTSSVEDTKSWIDDGEVLGSFVGIINLDNLDDLTPEFIQIKDTSTSLSAQNMLIKIESITVLGDMINNKVHLSMVTDSDGGDSEIISMIISIDVTKMPK
jgi:hypothetical protein